MRWSKIKNIIILLLCIVNLFLLSLVGLRAWRTQRGERETRERMIQVLANNGIEFLPAEVPGELSLAPVRVILSSNGETRTLESSLGADGQPKREPVRELLQAEGVEIHDLSCRVDPNGGWTGECTQLWDGVPVPQMTLHVHWNADGGATLTGRLLAGTEEPGTESGELISASTALTRFLKALNDGGYVCSQVTGLYAGYAASGAGTVSLTPAWFVETDAWPWRFAVDGYTGSVTAAE